MISLKRNIFRNIFLVVSMITLLHTAISAVVFGADAQYELAVQQDSIALKNAAEIGSTVLKGVKIDSTKLKAIVADSSVLDIVDADSKTVEAVEIDSVKIKTIEVDSAKIKAVEVDSAKIKTIEVDSTALDSMGLDTTMREKNAFLSDIITGTGKDSMIYNLKNGVLNIYKEGNIEYTNTAMKADFFEMRLNEDLIIAKGVLDTMTGVLSKAQFTEGETTYDLDSMHYNVDSKKAKIYEVAFKEGEGTLHGKDIKMVGDGMFNIHGGKYSTCDANCPHFYMHLTKAQFVQTEDSKKVIFGPMYMVIEDVPLPLALPFGFFPMMDDKNSGVILPEIGEENLKGFYVRGLGYYYIVNDYMDLTAMAGIYTMGSWEASLNSMYKVRYKYNGNFGLNYSKDIIGSEGSTDYSNMNNYRITWTHSQDPKFLPGSTFSANVNWSSSSYNKYDATDMDDYVSSQTNSSVSYSKTWAGTPFSLSTNLQHSQNNRDSTVMLSMPNVVFSVSRFMPFQRKNLVGTPRWYEKIAMSYTGTLNNSVTSKEDELFTPQMFADLKYGVKHDVPISTSVNVFKFFNVSPSINYTERWYFNSINKQWDPELEQLVVADTVQGFNRVFDYRFSAGVSTRIYGAFNFKGADPIVKAIRHVITPSVSGSYSPNFGDPKYGYYKAVQSSAQGDVTYYSPYENGIYGVPGRGQNASLSFSLGQSLEMKVRSRADTTGTKKLKIIESLQASSSYNFLADSMKLSTISVNLRTTLFKSFGLNINSTFDPYALDKDGRRIATYSIKQGKLARLTSLGFSFGYSFRSVFGIEDAGTGSGSIPEASSAQQQMFNENQVNYVDQQRILAQTYYDFSVPWNLSFNYIFSYSKPGLVPDLNQTLSFNGSINLTKKFGVTFNAGYDFEAKELTPGSVAMTRDLHCFQMSFSCVPIGFRKSWNFTIRAKSSMLSDLKYEKNSGYTNNFSSYY